MALKIGVHLGRADGRRPSLAQHNNRTISQKRNGPLVGVLLTRTISRSSSLSLMGSLSLVELMLRTEMMARSSRTWSSSSSLMGSLSLVELVLPDGLALLGRAHAPD